MENLLEKTKELCRIYEIHPARSKGQNFLINENVYDQIVEAAELKEDDVVLEVGPGLGFLTAKLAKKVKKVIAVELDDTLADYLKTAIKMQGVKNVEVRNENILDLSIKYNVSSIKQNGMISADKNIHNALYIIPDTKYKIVANLPYNITSVFLRKFLSESENKPEMMVLMLQKEVAQRIVAKPGEMSLLAISVQFYADAEIIGYVPKNDFWPAPAVDSAIIKIKLKDQDPSVLSDTSTPSASGHFPLPRGSKETYSPLARGRLRGGKVLDEKAFFRLVKFGFTAKRKMLKNNLAAGYHISQSEAEKKIVQMGLNPKIRAQELSIEDWKKLAPHFLRAEDL